MNRQILIACFPCFVVLCASFLILRLVLAVGTKSWSWQRLRQVHACQQGGVQSLAFVLTMPAFVMVVLLIVQVSQLMIAQMVIQQVPACRLVEVDDLPASRRGKGGFGSSGEK
mgnify:CR=1 FL=1